MAYVKNPVEGSNSCFGVVMADGLASTGNEKDGGYQKLFPIGKNYLLGTGDGGKIQFVADELYGKNELGPEILSEKLIDLSNKYFVFGQGEQLNFIVVGPDSKRGLAIYNISANRIKKPILTRGTFSFDGSGSSFVYKALERDASKGMLIDYKKLTIADLSSTLFDFGHVAKRSSGVNDEFQYGFITPEGNATLIDPRINIVYPLKEYLDENRKLSPELKERNDNFFKSLNQVLYEKHMLNVQSNKNLTELLSADPSISKEELIANLSKLKEAVDNNRDKINEMIMSYIKEHNK